jgi:Uma2 family endonuclease
MIQRTRQHFGLNDHGRRVSYDEFMSADYEPGYKYEIIDGEIYVSPLPNLPLEMLEKWLYRKLDRYADSHADIINFVSVKSRLFVPGRVNITVPEPDLVAYKDFPIDLPDEELDWRNVSPILVAEVISASDPNKDLVRNVELYWQIPSVKEYWVFDTRVSAALPVLVVHRRTARKWKVIEIAPGGTYATRLLPGFELVVDRSK